MTSAAAVPLLLPLLAAAAAGGPVAQEPDRPVPDERRMVAARVDEPPRIDGRVDEAAWLRAVPATDFRQVEPVEAGVPSERTEARVLYDEDTLYVAVICFDRDPAGILATELRRDQRMRTDDTVAVLLDTFHDHRNAYLFRVNPLGARYDAAIRDNSEVNAAWDETWEAAAAITARGWEAEFAIPFRSLRYPQGSHVWGIEFKRELRRRNEEIKWSNFLLDYRAQDIRRAGHLEGLTDLALAGRFRLKPFVGGDVGRAGEAGAATGGDVDAGIDDFKVQITPNLTADATLNPDFAEVEVDPERVNLTRFPLFFPERRTFFLEGAGNFDFGSRGDRGEVPAALLFFSRRIGLSEDGLPLPILFGAKLTGKIGRNDLGLVDVRTRDGGGVPGRNYAALRWSRDLLEQSSVGALVTSVRGPDGEDNRVAGVDADFTLLRNLRLSGFAAVAEDAEIDGRAWTGQLRGTWSSDLFSATVDWLRVDPDFVTRIGFIRRRDIVRRRVGVAYGPRPAAPWLRQLQLSAGLELDDDSAGRLVTRRQELGATLRLESGDAVSLGLERRFERLDEPFQPEASATVPAGDYEFDAWSAAFRAYEGRRVGGVLRVGGGGYFGGSRRALLAGPELRVSERVSLAAEYGVDSVDLPGGGFTAHVLNSVAHVSFSDRWLTTALVQYNGLTGEVATFARLDFIYRTGDDLFLVFKQSRPVDGPLAGSSAWSLDAKLTYSLEF